LEDAVAVYCVNVACPEQRVRQVNHFAAVMDIEGFGERTAQLFVDRGLVQDPADLYALGKEDLLSLEGFAEKSVQNLLAAIKASKDRPLAQVIAALGIGGVGGTVAHLLAQHYATLGDLARAAHEELEAIPGLGPHTASAIVGWFARQRNREFVDKLREKGVRLAGEIVAEQAQGALDGLTFVITGTLSRSRDKMAEMIVGNGGKVTGSVSGRTDYLLAGKAPGRSKYQAAQRLSVPIIDEAQLMALLSGGNDDQDTSSLPEEQLALFGQ
jgi:DNA ligase (NAD+)